MSKDVPATSTPKVPPPVAAPVSSLPPTQVSVTPVSEVCTQRPTPTPTPTPSLTTASSTTSSVSVSSPPPITPRPPTPSTHQQFTVHGQLFGPGDHCGPAPNVTVNPLYQPNLSEQPNAVQILRPIQNTPPATDQQIRVLTPSEIMRTLPSLCQESYEPQAPVRITNMCDGWFYPASFFLFVT